MNLLNFKSKTNLDDILRLHDQSEMAELLKGEEYFTFKNSFLNKIINSKEIKIIGLGLAVVGLAGIISFYCKK